jgi:hypothetical protein
VYEIAAVKLFEDFFYVPGDSNSIEHSCVALLYICNSIGRFTNGNEQILQLFQSSKLWKSRNSLVLVGENNGE